MGGEGHLLKPLGGKDCPLPCPSMTSDPQHEPTWSEGAHKRVNAVTLEHRLRGRGSLPF